MIRDFLLRWQIKSVDGTLCISPDVLQRFLAAPADPLPSFEGPPNFKLKRSGRGKDHPRYGRFVYALAAHYQPENIVEVGTFAGGTAVGFGAALAETGHGKLYCIDQDSYSQGTFPQVVTRNLQRVGLPATRVEFCVGDSKVWLPKLSERLAGQVDICLVDGDHTYEGALLDLNNTLPLIKPGGLILVHDIDRGRRMDEETPEHPHPVYEAFHRLAQEHGLEWCILKFIRKHLGILRLPPAEAARQAA